jgi:predicted RNase H-like nuclease (RuvC/YqgF family)
MILPSAQYLIVSAVFALYITVRIMTQKYWYQSENDRLKKKVRERNREIRELRHRLKNLRKLTVYIGGFTH